jgi:hypothetical protein
MKLEHADTSQSHNSVSKQGPVFKILFIHTSQFSAHGHGWGLGLLTAVPIRACASLLDRVFGIGLIIVLP